MAPKIIVCAALKGGTGKPSLSMQIAGTLALRGHKVLVADAARHGTASRRAKGEGDDVMGAKAVHKLERHAQRGFALVVAAILLNFAVRMRQ